MELRENTYEEAFPFFEHAYFGKPYETRDGRKVIYINSNLNNHYLRDEDDYCIEVCSDGRAHYNDRDIDSEDDIISEWQEPIDEEELDELAFYAEKETFKKSDLPFQTKWVDGFKAGYHKAKEI